MEVNLLHGAWIQMNALESAKSANGRAGHIGKLQIELYHFIAGDFSRVRDSDGGVEGIARVDRRVRQGQIAVAEGRITEAKSERPQRLALEVAVGASVHRVVLKMGQLVNILIKRHRQTPGGIVLPAQRLGNCSA